MKLLVDIGNTSAKLAVADNDIVHCERLVGTWSDTLSRLIKEYDITSVRISTVVNDNEELHDFIEHLHLPALWLSSNLPYPQEPLKNVPKGFGADRWVADVGAMSLAPNRTLLVIDAGTCITYDVISSAGEFLGGAISPGVQLRLTAMHEHTARLPLIDATGLRDATELIDTTGLINATGLRDDAASLIDDATCHEADFLGHDTQTSMLSSAINGTKYEIEGYIRRLLKIYPDLHVFISGGNDFRLADDISCPIKHVPNLVLIGLNVLT